MSSDTLFDALVVGGSVAGLSAALMLGRSRRRVLVLDAGSPANRQTPHSHSFFTRDGATPQQLLAIAREQLLPYTTVQLRTATVTHITPDGPYFSLSTEDGQTFRGRKLLLATGIRDEMPALPGFADCWGISVLHCPYCHGYEVHSQPLGVLGNGDMGFHFARMIQHWSADLRVFTNGPSTFTAEQTQQLQAHSVRIIETPLAALEHEAGQLRYLRLTSDEQVPLTALFAHVPFSLPLDFHAQLGCELTENGHLRTNEMGATTVPGVFAAGDLTTPMRQISVASAQGGMTGGALDRELIAADF
ncbi:MULTISPECIES: NAD(P)/FAD-dependent oxidoreductase [Hymenobacter]|uniref:NAD(P)/FAD-dependent oxidoreductase n=2 Tax=Hymenobacter TaxID=89966 RepID=A0ABS6X529_9BACT|nr:MULTISPECIES: NAD(P)/FAD-dependent oxidoreductase [Hymenobacter]MBO3269540.1 NAD(P)/FAD-dependent oxidoreductase [Hymenobacter defluvii]MBW3130421.1 NAD(P)/FAD-dependent oxidoreductase [Hymenobacter profundi]